MISLGEMLIFNPDDISFVYLNDARDTKHVSMCEVCSTVRCNIVVSYVMGNVGITYIL